MIHTSIVAGWLPAILSEQNPEVFFDGAGSGKSALLACAAFSPLAEASAPSKRISGFFFGRAMKWSNCRRCSEPASNKGWRAYLCDKHYRFDQMRYDAKRDGKAVPTRDDLETMPGVNLSCPDCGVSMHWLRAHGNATVATLQHYRNGTMAIVCFSCNSRHRFQPGDTYREMPKDHKWCRKCSLLKPFSAFTEYETKKGVKKFCGYCIECYRAIGRARYQARKAA